MENVITFDAETPGFDLAYEFESSAIQFGRREQIHLKLHEESKDLFSFETIFADSRHVFLIRNKSSTKTNCRIAFAGNADTRPGKARRELDTWRNYR